MSHTRKRKLRTLRQQFKVITGYGLRGTARRRVRHERLLAIYFLLTLGCVRQHHFGGEYWIDQVTVNSITMPIHDRSNAVVELPGAKLVIHPAWQGATYIIVRLSVAGNANLMLEEYAIRAPYMSGLDGESKPEYFIREGVGAMASPLELPRRLMSDNFIDMFARALDAQRDLHTFHLVVTDDGKRHVIEVKGRRIL